VADRYADFAVLKLYSAGLKPHRAHIVSALMSTLPIKGVWGRDEVGRDGDPNDDDDAASNGGQVLAGDTPPERIAIRERGTTLLVDVRNGQKTGLFLDQRENRRAVRKWSKGRSVLNCFSFMGGFSVQAALGGATRVVSVDQDGDAMALAQDIFRANQLDVGQHDFVTGDVSKYLASAKQEGASFGLIVLDPPAFTKSQKTVEAALDGYASLNRAALQVLDTGGLLVTASCSARVSYEEFFGTIKEAAFKAKVDLQLVEQHLQPADHPVAMQLPEGRYLKLMVLRRVN